MVDENDQVKIEFIDKRSLVHIGSEYVDKEVLGRIYYLAAELGITAEEVLGIACELALEELGK